MDHDLALHSLAGLDALASVRGDLVVTRNRGLTSLAALGALISIDGELRIDQDDTLRESVVAALDARLAGASCSACTDTTGRAARPKV